MNEQEVFNTVYNGLKSQGFKRSVVVDKVTGEERCKYRCGDLKCAAGWLIDDSDYDSRYEGYGIEGVWDDVLPNLDKTKYGSMVGCLQDVHDQTYHEFFCDEAEKRGLVSAEALEEELEKDVNFNKIEFTLGLFAKKHNLEIPKDV